MNAGTTVNQFNLCYDDELCVDIQKCTLFLPNYNKPAMWSDALRETFRKRVCQRQENFFGTVSIHVGSIGRPLFHSQTPPQTYKVCCGANHIRKYGLELLKLDGCETAIGARIPRLVRGEDAPVDKFPWMVLVFNQRNTSICTGSLLNEHYVLTLASFKEQSHSPTHVRLGELDRNSAIDCDERGKLCAEPPQDIAIERIIPHPDYILLTNNIGLLRLARKASFNDNVYPICLPVLSAFHRIKEPNAPTIQRRYLVVGWGLNENFKPNNKLKSIKVSVVPNDECQNQFSTDMLVARIIDSHICAIGQNMSGTCRGDAGAPMIAMNVNGLYVQYGLLSFGPGSCSYADIPDVYTRVESFVPWILDNLEEPPSSTHKVCCGADNIRKHGLELLKLDGCETAIGARIPRLGRGEDAPVDTFPWMVMVLTENNHTLCTGSLLNERYVLTAAHCAYSKLPTHVRLGELDRNSTIDCNERGKLCAEPPQDIAVEKVTRHNDYRFRVRHNDIALIRLAETATLNNNVYPICLPVLSALHRIKDPNAPTIQRRYLVVGWGLNENDEINNKLKSIKVSVVPNGECQQRLTTYNERAKIFDSHICAIGQNMSGTCGGDAGAPMIAMNVNGLYVQYGLLSFGPGSCSYADIPDVYTRVESFVPWILDTLEE
uniref:Peptidase S1 domain-containing protein n=1 Tax=Anopheles dirus TaxID=7168 RepID=A0A182NF69_9DIPT